MFIQLVILAVVVWGLVLTWKRSREGALSRLAAAAWTLLWLGAATVTVWPSLASRFAAALGVGRGADAVLYIAVISLFYLVFRIFLRLDKIERDITAVIREAALSNSKDKVKE